jgi:hypothetical protein
VNRSIVMVMSSVPQMGTPKPHPALKDELNNRVFVRQTLRALGLVYEPVRSGPGRPSGAAWRGRQKIHAD